MQGQFDRGSGDGAPSTNPVGVRLGPATFLAVFRVIEFFPIAARFWSVFLRDLCDLLFEAFFRRAFSLINALWSLSMPFSKRVRHGRSRHWIALAAVLGFAAGTLIQHSPLSVMPTARADGHGDGKAEPSSVKAPIAEVMHCPLAFEGTHLLKELPEVAQVAYHYCKPMNDDLVAQCLLYDGTGPMPG